MLFLLGKESLGLKFDLKQPEDFASLEEKQLQSPGFLPHSVSELFSF